jgi:hypothetical protein
MEERGIIVQQRGSESEIMETKIRTVTFIKLVNLNYIRTNLLIDAIPY